MNDAEQNIIFPLVIVVTVLVVFLVVGITYAIKKSKVSSPPKIEYLAPQAPLPTNPIDISPGGPTKNKAAAIAELRKTNCEYADALSGNNPPNPEDLSGHRQLSIVCMYGVPPFLFASWIASVFIMPWFFLIILAFIFYVIGAFFFAVGEHQKTKAIPTPPFAMKLMQDSLSRNATDREITLYLEYEVPGSYENRDFDKLIRSSFERIASAYVQEKLEKYGNHCKEQQTKPVPDEYTNSLNCDEVEAELVPSFGQAVFESRVHVFRFKIIKQIVLTEQAPATIPMRGFVGTSL